MDDDFRLVAKHDLYHCHDLLIDHIAGLFTHLQERWSSLFQADFDVLLYDLTSSRFKADATGEVAQASARVTDEEKTCDSHGKQ